MAQRQAFMRWQAHSRRQPVDDPSDGPDNHERPRAIVLVSRHFTFESDRDQYRRTTLVNPDSGSKLIELLRTAAGNICPPVSKATHRRAADSSLTPYRLGSFHNKFQLASLVVLGDGVPVFGGGKTALGSDP